MSNDPDLRSFPAMLPIWAISVRQPWAWAIIHGGKPVENRVKRAITLGGMDKHKSLAIHAASGMTREEYEGAREFMASIEVDCPRPDALIRGAVIGSVIFDGITNASDSPWFFGPWALVLRAPVACKPQPSRGELGAFQWRKGKLDACRDPLPWMTSWPERPGRQSVAPAGDLLL